MLTEEEVQDLWEKVKKNPTRYKIELPKYINLNAFDEKKWLNVCIKPPNNLYISIKKDNQGVGIKLSNSKYEFPSTDFVYHNDTAAAFRAAFITYVNAFTYLIDSEELT